MVGFDTRWCVFGSFEGFRYFPRRSQAAAANESAVVGGEDQNVLGRFSESRIQDLQTRGRTTNNSIKVEQTPCMDQFGGWLDGWMVGWLVGWLVGFLQKN